MIVPKISIIRLILPYVKNKNVDPASRAEDHAISSARFIYIFITCFSKG
jgi:hypothetical protein